MRLWHFFCSVTGLILWILVIIRAHPHRRTRQKVASLFQQTKTHFDVDHSPILRTETVEAWSDKKEPEGNDADGNEEVDEAQVSNDDEGTVGLPSKAEKAPEVLIEKEKNHIGNVTFVFVVFHGAISSKCIINIVVWGMWGPWESMFWLMSLSHVVRILDKLENDYGSVLAVLVMVESWRIKLSLAIVNLVRQIFGNCKLPQKHLCLVLTQIAFRPFLILQ